MAPIGQVDKIEGLNTPPAIILWRPVDLRDAIHIVSFTLGHLSNHVTSVLGLNLRIFWETSSSTPNALIRDSEFKNVHAPTGLANGPRTCIIFTNNS
jgi:hypothetical protein